MQLFNPKKNPQIHRVLKGAVYLGSAQFMRVVFRALYIIVLARFLGPEMFGLYNYGLGWYLAFMSLTQLGFDLILSKEGGRNKVDSDIFVAGTLRVQLLVTIFTTLTCWVVALVLEEQEVSVILGVFSLALMGRSLSAWVSFVFTSREKSNRVFWLESTCRMLETLSGTVILFRGGGLLEIAIIHTLFWWIQAIWGLIELSAYRLLLIPNHVSDIIKNLGGGPIILGFASVFQIWTAQAPLILFRQLGGNAILLGEISIAFQVLGLLAGLSWAILRAALPQLSRSVEAKRSADLTFTNLLFSVTIVGGGVAVALTIILADTILFLIVGDEYIAAAKFLPYTVAASAEYTIGVGAHQILAAHRKYNLILWGTATGAIITTSVMLLIWPISMEFAPFISLLAGLVAWSVVVGGAVYNITRFSLWNVLVIPLTVSTYGVGLAYIITPLGITTALLAFPPVFLLWACYKKLSK